MPVADHQAAAVFIPLGRKRRDIGATSASQRLGQHPPRALPHDLVDQRRRAILAPSRLEHRQGLPVSIGLYLPGPRVNAGHCLRPRGGHREGTPLPGQIHRFQALLYAAFALAFLCFFAGIAGRRPWLRWQRFPNITVRVDGLGSEIGGKQTPGFPLGSAQARDDESSYHERGGGPWGRHQGGVPADKSETWDSVFCTNSCSRSLFDRSNAISQPMPSRFR